MVHTVTSVLGTEEQDLERGIKGIEDFVKAEIQTWKNICR